MSVGSQKLQRGFRRSLLRHWVWYPVSWRGVSQRRGRWGEWDWAGRVRGGLPGQEDLVVWSGRSNRECPEIIFRELRHIFWVVYRLSPPFPPLAGFPYDTTMDDWEWAVARLCV